VAARITDLQKRLWDEAYSQARASDQKAVDTYEVFLSTRLYKDDTGTAESQASEVDNTEQNEIVQDADKRRLQMSQLIESGLRRTEKDAKAKQKMGDIIKVIASVKGVVDKAVQTSPVATMVWASVCFGLEVCSAATELTAQF
jgi:post-segregation antitoxin (ccd killing protein)